MSRGSSGGLGGLLALAAVVGGFWLYDNSTNGTDSSSTTTSSTSTSSQSSRSSSGISGNAARGGTVEISTKTDPKILAEYADKGNSAAQINLGILHAEGRGVKRDMKKAESLFKRASMQGEPKANFNLGLLYDRGGPGMKANKKNAIKYYRKAADAGIADGMYNLAILYAKGEGTRKDMIQAYKWATIASKHSPSEADRRGAKQLLVMLDQLASSNEKRLAKSGAAKWKPRK